LSLIAATIEGDLDCTGAALTGRDFVFSLNGDHLKVVGETRLGVDKMHNFTARSRVSFIDAEFGRGFSCDGARLLDPGVALVLDGSEFSNGVSLSVSTKSERFTARGTVSLVGATVRNDVDCRGALLMTGRRSLSLDRLTCEGGLRLSEAEEHRLVANGVVSFIGATLKGGVTCLGAEFRGKPFSLIGDYARVQGGLRIGGPDSGSQDENGGRYTIAYGGVRFVHATIEGDVDFVGTFLLGIPSEDSLSLDGCRVSGSVFLGADLLKRPAGRTTYRVRRRTFRFVTRGPVRLTGAHVDGGLRCDGGVFRKHPRQGVATEAESDAYEQPTGGLLASGLVVTQSFVWRPALARGELVLYQAQVDRLADNLNGWSALTAYDLREFRYARFRPDAPQSWAERRQWLARQQPFSPQPYRHLAQPYRDTGHEAEARDVEFEQEKQRRRRGAMSPLGRFHSRSLRMTIGHGLRPQRACVWLLGLYVVGVVMSSLAKDAGTLVPTSSAAIPILEAATPATGFVSPPSEPTPSEPPTSSTSTKGYNEKSPTPSRAPASGSPSGSKAGTASSPASGSPSAPRPQPSKCIPEYPCFNRFVYPLDVPVPLINFRQAQFWQPAFVSWEGRGLATFAWVGTFIGWLLSSLALAGATGLVRRR